MSKDGNIIMIAGITLIIGVAVYVATQSGSYINNLIKDAAWWRFVISGFGFISAVGLIVKYSNDSKAGIGFSAKKAFSILIALAVAIGVFYV